MFGLWLFECFTPPLKTARSMTEDSRKHNRDRLAQKAKAHDISPGDSVMIKSEERLTLTARWNPRWTVTPVRGPVIYVHNQQTESQKLSMRRMSG